ncbi:hypothetical protein MNV49_006660 [Pseudohyphozyma bogoriensis]|nr:hypothetical protein MNV49_006660 [Pseudohyphozyma bogoriensis]
MFDHYNSRTIPYSSPSAASSSTTTPSPASSSVSTLGAPWLDSSDSYSDASTGETSGASDKEDAFVDANEQLGQGSHVRRPSWASEASALSSDDSEGLEDLNRAAALLDQLEDAIFDVQVISTPPRRRPAPFRPPNDPRWSPSASPVAGPSRDRHRQTPAPPSSRSEHHLSSFASTSTLTAASVATRNVARKRASFTQTDLATLDIDDLLAKFDEFAFELELEQEIALAAADAHHASPGRTPTQATHAHARAAPVFPSRRQLFPASPRVAERGGRRPSDLPYAELFPSMSTSGTAFPSRKKSTTSLRSTHTACPPDDVVPPLPFPSRGPFPTAAASPFPSTPRTQRLQRASIVSTSSNSTTSSSASHFSSGDSFRWSVASGSTATSVSEEDCSSRRGSVATFASTSSRASSARSFPSRDRRQNSLSEELGYMDFLNEVADGEEADGEGEHGRQLRREPSFASRLALRRQASGKSSLHSKYAHSQRSSNGLPRSPSSVSLKRIRSNASLNPPPPIPTRSSSMADVAVEKGKTVAFAV